MNGLYLIPVVALLVVGLFVDWRIFVALAIVVGGALGAMKLAERMGGKKKG